MKYCDFLEVEVRVENMKRMLMWGISEGVALLINIEVWEDKLVLKNYEF